MAAAVGSELGLLVEFEEVQCKPAQRCEKRLSANAVSLSGGRYSSTVYYALHLVARGLPPTLARSQQGTQTGGCKEINARTKAGACAEYEWHQLSHAGLGQRLPGLVVETNCDAVLLAEVAMAYHTLKYGRYGDWEIRRLGDTISYRHLHTRRLYRHTQYVQMRK
eukprot:IDg4566t1